MLMSTFFAAVRLPSFAMLGRNDRRRSQLRVLACGVDDSYISQLLLRRKECGCWRKRKSKALLTQITKSLPNLTKEAKSTADFSQSYHR